MSFEKQPELTGPTLFLRGLRESDRAALFRAASAPENWAGHPSKDRWKPEVFDAYFDFLMNAGGTLVVITRSNGQVIGCSRYYDSPDIAGDIGIGFTFVHHSFWGGVVNRELKKLMLDHAFTSFERVWFHIDPSNLRSQKATRKLGVDVMEDTMVDLGSGALVWKRFCLTKQSWRALTLD